MWPSTYPTNDDNSDDTPVKPSGGRPGFLEKAVGYAWHKEIWQNLALIFIFPSTNTLLLTPYEHRNTRGTELDVILSAGVFECTSPDKNAWDQMEKHFLRSWERIKTGFKVVLI